MKLRRFFYSTFYLQLALFCLSCNKKKLTEAPEPIKNTPMTAGLPTSLRTVNAFLYAALINDSSGVEADRTYISLYSVFNDPGTNLMKKVDHYSEGQLMISETSPGGNVSVGKVKFTNITLFSSFSPAYYFHFGEEVSPLAKINARWTTEGNLTFVPLTNEIPGTFPLVTVPPGSVQVNSCCSFSVSTPGYFSNCDSVSVTIYNSYIKKSVSKSSAEKNPVFVFTSSELEQFSGQPNTVLIYQAINYSHFYKEDKLYVFELGSKMKKKMYIY